MRKAQISKKPGGKLAPKAVTAKAPDRGIVISSKLTLPKELQLNMLDLMIKARVLEERLIKVYKAGDSFFWIGAPGEEAFGVPLGLLVNKGRGLDHDFLHLHYRGTPTLVAMGMSPDMVFLDFGFHQAQ